MGKLKGHFENALQLFTDEYKPTFFNRIGLRYIDLINRDSLGLSGVPWRELLTTHIAGELSSPEVGDNVISCANQLTIRLDNEGSRIFIESRACR